MNKPIVTSKQIVEFLKPSIQRIVYLIPKNRFIFLCGSAKKEAARYVFMNYVLKHHIEYIPILAENFFGMEDDGIVDLLSVENEIADISDCVLVFLESESCFAELGAFSNTNICKKMLVVNQKKYSESPSFINLGPIAKVTRESDFENPVICNFSSSLQVADTILQRIEKGTPQKRKRIERLSSGDFSITNSQLKLSFILEILSLATPIKKKELVNICKAILKFDSKVMNSYIKFILTAELFEEVDCFLIPKRLREGILDTVSIYDKSKCRAKVLRYYKKFDPTRMSIYCSEIRKKK